MKILTMEEERYCEVAALSICSHLGAGFDKKEWLAQEIQKIVNDVKSAAVQDSNNENL
jgi:hypothetical protein